MRLTRHVLDAVVRHARDAAPEECCGILLGPPGDPSTAATVLPAKNAEADQPSSRYSLGHEAHLRAADLETEGQAEIVGYYHSHPQGTAQPSRRDVELAVEDTAYLIVGLSGRSVEYAVWQREGGRGALARQPVEVVDGDHCRSPVP